MDELFEFLLAHRDWVIFNARAALAKAPRGVEFEDHSWVRFSTTWTRSDASPRRFDLRPAADHRRGILNNLVLSGARYHELFGCDLDDPKLRSRGQESLEAGAAAPVAARRARRPAAPPSRRGDFAEFSHWRSVDAVALVTAPRAASPRTRRTSWRPRECAWRWWRGVAKRSTPLAAEIAGKGGEACAFPCDVECAAEWRRPRAPRPSASERGPARQQRRLRSSPRVLDWDLDDMERMMRVNYVGALRFTRHCYPLVAAAGSLIFVASVAGKIGHPTRRPTARPSRDDRPRAGALARGETPVHVLVSARRVIRTPFFDAEALARMPPVSRRSMVGGGGPRRLDRGSLARGSAR